MAEKKESIGETSRVKKDSRENKRAKSDFEPFYAGVSEKWIVATCGTKEEVISSLKSQGTSRSTKFNIYKVYVDGDSRYMFSLSLDDEDHEFDLENTHWNRLYIEIYHFLRGAYHLNPELRQTIIKDNKSRFVKKIIDAFRFWVC